MSHLEEEDSVMFFSKSTHRGWLTCLSTKHKGIVGHLSRDSEKKLSVLSSWKQISRHLASGSLHGTRGSFRRPDWLREGGAAYGFEVLNCFHVPEFDMEVWHLSHHPTGARYVHVGCEDLNNVFCATLRTPVNDSSGLPHVLEHSVLCGSEKFPVRDPFFNMTKRSLNTFMNAMTGQEYTMYPFATQNEQDFYNLMDVYLDAVFFPRLTKLDFCQEGHRLEVSPSDRSQLVRNGVVYNEMKGVLGSTARVFSNELDKAILPGTQYEFISGGYPPAIASLLTHERLVEYHRKHYHPSNALFFTYGDLDLDAHLKRLDSWILNRYSFSDAASNVWKSIASSSVETSRQPRGYTVEAFGPPEPMLDPERSSIFSMSRVLSQKAADRSDGYTRLVDSMTSSLLLDGNSAPLYVSLIDRQLAPEFCPGVGYDSGVHPSFTIGVQGIDGHDESLDLVRKTIFETLAKVSEEGFDSRRVEGVLHQVELSLKRKPVGFGLNVMQALCTAFAHCSDGNNSTKLLSDLNDALTVNKKIDRLKSDIAERPRFWQDAVERLFLQRSEETGDLAFADDIVQLLMKPDRDFVEKQNQEEAKALIDTRTRMSDSDMIKIEENSKALKESQMQVDDVSCLPTLSVFDDVPRKSPSPVSVEDVSSFCGRSKNSVFWTEGQKTNGLVYFRLLFDISDLPVELLPLTSTFSSMLGSVSAGSLSYPELGVQLDLSCDGLSFSPSLLQWFGSSNDLFPAVHDVLNHSHSLGVSDAKNSVSSVYRQCISVSGCCLVKNLNKTVDLLSSILTESSFGDSHRIQSILASQANSVSTGLTSNALGYAHRWANAALGGNYARSEVLSGLTQTEVLMTLANRSEEVAGVYQGLLKSIFRPEKMTMGVVAGGSEIDQEVVLKSLSSLYSKLDGQGGEYPASISQIDGVFSETIKSLHERSDLRATYIELPISVHNTAVSVPTSVRYGHPDDAALMVFGQIASSNFLHKEIREQGGAYGSNASHGMDGLFHFDSFYDPRSLESLQAYSKAIEWGCNGLFSDRDVDEALLSLFGSFDAPLEIGSKGSGSFHHGTTPEDRQNMRDRIFSVSKKKVVDACKTHLGHVVNESHDGFVNGPLKGLVAIAGNENNSKDIVDAHVKSWDCKQL